ncbi:MAG: FAD-binding oxidoreductase [Lysobacteraceae bacterium]|nr:MAG: FAD-binding oxidoreductase [Xanthomonadaceae bacterium]
MTEPLPAGDALATSVADVVAGLGAIVGEAHLVTDPGAMAPFLTDWRGRFTGRALAVVLPADTVEVARVVQLCAAARIPIVPQGGRTGLVLGSVPDASGSAIVLSLRRLDRIRHIDAANRTMTVEAGCILDDIQQAAAGADMLFPLSLASEGSCTIGGNLSTNAGGTAVLRYGNARELCLGLEVVTAQGQVWNGLRALRKDNTGYALRELFIGAEGTLGIITAAVLKLHPQPKAALTALVALESPRTAVALLSLAQERCGPALTGFELMSDFCLRLVATHFPGLPRPFAAHYPHYALLELSSNESEDNAADLVESAVGAALDAGIALDAVLATSIGQSIGLWKLREHIPLAQATAGKNIKHDISLPVSSIPDFIEQTDTALQSAFPGCQVVCFGHLGDGNLHYNIAPPDGVGHDSFLAHQDAVNGIVHDSVAAFDGSISAEHGIGALKRDALPHYKQAVELDMMRAVKAALDPLGIMNPGKIL